MMNKILLACIPVFFLVQLFVVSAESMTMVEVFDVEEKEIIKTIPTNQTIQKEAEKVLKEVDNIIKKLNPTPDSGYMIKIPLGPSIHVENKWVDVLIDEVIVIIPKEEEAYLLIFDDENYPYFLTFNANIDTLRNEVDIPNN